MSTRNDKAGHRRQGKNHILAAIAEGRYETAWSAARAMDPADWQAANAEFDDVVVTIDAGRRKTRVQSRQRSQDRRVLDAIDEVPSGARAAVWIACGFRAIADGVMPQAPRYHQETVDTGEGVDPERAAVFLLQARNGYLAWQVECQKRQIPTRPVIDILVWGVSMASADALHRKRKGWSRAVLLQALALFVLNNGWEAPAALQPWTQPRAV